MLLNLDTICSTVWFIPTAPILCSTSPEVCWQPSPLVSAEPERELGSFSYVFWIESPCLCCFLCQAVPSTRSSVYSDSCGPQPPGPQPLFPYLLATLCPGHHLWFWELKFVGLPLGGLVIPFLLPWVGGCFLGDHIIFFRTQQI